MTHQNVLRLDPLTLPLSGRRLIEASAGTGKTYTITTLYLRALVERRLDVSQILVVTFTRAATDELRDRLRGRLAEAARALEADPVAEEWHWLLAAAASAPPEQSDSGIAPEDQAVALLRQALQNMDTAAIFTIHGFCQRALQDHAFDSGVMFELSLEQDTSDLLEESCQQIWREHFYADAGLAELAFKAGITGPESLLGEIRSYLAKADLNLPDTQPNPAVLGQAAGTLRTMWKEQGEAACALLAEAAGVVLSKAKDKGYSPEQIVRICQSMNQWCHDSNDIDLPDVARLLAQHTVDSLVLSGARKKGLEAPRHALFEAVENFVSLAEEQRNALLVFLIRTVQSRFTGLKKQRHVLGFDDLILHLREATEGEAGERLTQTLRHRYPLAMIDEFQDTDPDQYRIFSRIYPSAVQQADSGQGPGLLMIGDPKQAIYSFRGADIFAYLNARRHTDGAYSMATNWRSHSTLVDAVNRIFTRHEDPFSLGNEIPFLPVQAAGNADREPFLRDGRQQPALVCWQWQREADQQTKTIDKKTALPALAAAVAGDIAALLNSGSRGGAQLGTTPVQPGDIAILVRKGSEAAELQRELQSRGINSVFLSRDSVFNTQEADDLHFLMQALLEPQRERLVRAALVTDIWGYSAEDLEALTGSDEAWDQLRQHLDRLHHSWQKSGFMVAFQQWLHEFGIPAQLLAGGNGERSLTNLLHLAGLLQNARSEAATPEALLAWYTRQREHQGQHEAHQLRLESDDDLVKIVTIHSSKGLEFPLVYCPYLGLGSDLPRPPYAIHLPEQDNRLVLDFGSSEAAQTRAEQEARSEDLRLLYVALTRARQQCVFAWGAFRQMQNTALAWLLYGGPEGIGTRPDDDRIFAPLQELASDCAAFTCVAMPETQQVREAVAQAAPVFSARQIHRPVQQYWTQTSYSQLAQSDTAHEQPAHHLSRLEELGEALNAFGQAELMTGAGVQEAGVQDTHSLSLLGFPAGSQSGLCLHSILEDIDFQASDPAQLETEISHYLHYYQIGDQPEAWIEPLQDGLWNVLHTPLPEVGEHFCLAQLAEQDKKVEMEFFLPVRNAESSRISHYLHDYWQREEPVQLSFRPVTGQLHGFIDLIFTHNGRFYLVDYKSNRLGDQLHDYSRDNMAEAIRQHRYDLQYLIYALALHRYLQQKLPGYQYETHFGGVYYLFLRGMSQAGDERHGVYVERPTAQALGHFASLMQGEPL